MKAARSIFWRLSTALAAGAALAVHMNDLGYQAMANAIDLGLIKAR